MYYVVRTSGPDQSVSYLVAIQMTFAERKRDDKGEEQDINDVHTGHCMCFTLAAPSPQTQPKQALLMIDFCHELTDIRRKSLIRLSRVALNQ